MSASARMRFDVTASPTRQQLDELDALMQRMLALPVHPEADASPEPVVLRPTPKPKEPVTITETFDFGPFAAEPAAVATAAPTEPAPPTVRIDPLFDFSALVETPPVPTTAPAVEESSPTTSAAENYPTLVDRAPGFLVYPLLQFDRLFELTSFAFGPVGTVLRGHFGKSVLGALGVLLLTLAGVWCVLDGIGWTW